MLPAFLKLSRLEYCAVLLATLLSIACAARGAVYDVSIVTALLALLPLLWLSLNTQYQAPAVFFTLGKTMILAFIAWMGVQYLWVESLDIAAWKTSLGRVIFVAMIYAIAMQIGASTKASRLFFLTLLFSGIVLVGASFILHGSQLTLHSASYSHGFINPNNAASYLGIMLIICIAMIDSFLRHNLTAGGKSLPERMDNINFVDLAQLTALVFGLLLFLSGLFLTQSRGGVVLALAMSGALLGLAVFKRRNSQKGALFSASVLILAVVFGFAVIWLFTEHGVGLTQEMHVQGLDPDARPALFSAILPMIGDHPVLGHGLGGFASAFPAYRPDAMPVEGIYDKAHNSYLELAVEMGIPALLGLFAVMVILAKRFAAGLRERRKHYGIPSIGMAVLVFMALHSSFDFPLQIPSLLGLVVSILVVSVIQSDRKYILSKSRTRKKRRVKTSRKSGRKSTQSGARVAETAPYANKH